MQIASYARYIRVRGSAQTGWGHAHAKVRCSDFGILAYMQNDGITASPTVLVLLVQLLVGWKLDHSVASQILPVVPFYCKKTPSKKQQRVGELGSTTACAWLTTSKSAVRSSGGCFGYLDTSTLCVSVHETGQTLQSCHYSINRIKSSLLVAQRKQGFWQQSTLQTRSGGGAA